MPSVAQTNFSAEPVATETRPHESGTAGAFIPYEEGRPRHAVRTFRGVSETSAAQRVETFEPVVIRELNREVTRRELLPQREKVAKERAHLFRKGLDGPLSQREQRALRYLEWQLDRIEDAEIGEALDKLSAIADVNAALERKVEAWIERVKGMRQSQPKHAGRKARKR
jgi:hypothetical protein